MPAKRKATSKPASTKRPYNNRSRTEAAEQSKLLIVQTLVALLVEKRGGEVTFKEIALRSGVPERTIFRFYEDKESLHAAMDVFLASYIENAVSQLAAMDVAAFARNAYRLFDEYEALVQAYVYSPFGQQARHLFRRKLNVLIENKLHSEKQLVRTPELSRKIALICSLINAKIWSDLKQDFGFTGKEMGNAVEWAVRALIKELT